MEISRAYHTMYTAASLLYWYIRVVIIRVVVVSVLVELENAPQVVKTVDMASKCSFPSNPTKYVRSTIKKNTIRFYSILLLLLLFFLF